MTLNIINLADCIVINRSEFQELIVNGIKGADTSMRHFEWESDGDSKRLALYFQLKKETYEEIGRALGIDPAIEDET